MHTEDLHTGAAQLRRHASKNPMQILQDLINNDHTASSSILWRKWWKVIRDDDDLQEATALYAFSNYLDQIERVKRKPKTKKKTAEEISIERDEIVKLTSRIQKISLMNLLLPSGKKLQDATFAECSAAGGWFKLLATKGRPSQRVGDVLSEADLHAIGKK